MKKILLKRREISDNKPPLIVGEISANHSKSLNKILRMIDIARDIGLEAIKIQTFKPEEMTFRLNKREFSIKQRFENKDWNNRSLFSIYKEAHLPFEWHEEIFKKANKMGIIAFSSVFDEISLKLLHKFNVPAFKIASLESQHYPLIEKVIKKNKPIIVSTGTLSMKEIFELDCFFKKKKFFKYALLHCITQYPANYKNLNLKTILTLKKKLKTIIVFSDHTDDGSAAVAAVSLGANIIEKHFKETSKDKTLDSNFSLDPKAMKKLIIDCNNVWKSLGNSKKKISSDEEKYKNYRRSIYASKDIKIGDKISLSNVKIIRPNKGLAPRLLKNILGKKAKKNIRYATPITLKLFR